MDNLLEQLAEILRFKVYHISYDTSDEDVRRQLAKNLEDRGAGHILESSWLLRSTDSAREVLHSLTVQGRARIFISEVSANWSSNL